MNLSSEKSFPINRAPSNGVTKTLSFFRLTFDHVFFSFPSYRVRWIEKFVPKISEYVNSLAPTELSDTWHVDELFVKMKGGVTNKTSKNIAYLWNVMDRKTRFLLASKLSHYRDNIGCNAGLNEVIRNSHGLNPERIYSDSNRAYWGCVENVFSYPSTRPIHIPKAGINKPHANNNQIERLNETLRERDKVQREWKSYETPLAEGQ